MRWLVSLFLRTAALIALVGALALPAAASAADTTPPSTPTVSPNEWGGDVGDTYVVVRWGASTDNAGGSGLHHYVVNYEDQYFQVPAGTLQYRVNGLGPDSEYDMFVTAVDAAGNVSGILTRSFTTRSAGWVAPSPTPVPTATATPTPTPTVSPTPTPTVVPTITPVPTATPLPTATPVVTPSPVPTATPVVTPSPVPTPTPTATPEPAPTSAPVATATPKASVAATPKPTTVPVPTVIPTVTFKVASPQVSPSLSKVTFAVTGAPAGSVVTATLMRSGKPIGIVERSIAGSPLTARVAVSAAARKALRKRSRVRLSLSIVVKRDGATIATRQFGITVQRKRGK